MMFEKIFPKIHQEGYKFLVISSIITLILLFSTDLFGYIFILISIWVYYFFRDPERVVIDDEAYLVSPADGRISGIKEVNGPVELGLDSKKFTRVSIFMNIFDCHVNRSPTKGQIQEIILSTDEHCVITVPPLIWNGFKVIGEDYSIVANCSDIPHDPNEIKRRNFNDEYIPYRW